MCDCDGVLMVLVGSSTGAMPDVMLASLFGHGVLYVCSWKEKDEYLSKCDGLDGDYLRLGVIY